MRTTNQKTKPITLSSIDGLSKAVERKTYLQRHTFEFDDRYALALVKMALQPDLKTPETFPNGDVIYPDLVYFREWTGILPTISGYTDEQTLTIVDEESGETSLFFPLNNFNYVIETEAEENILNYLRKVVTENDEKGMGFILENAHLFKSFVEGELKRPMETVEDVKKVLEICLSDNSDKMYRETFNKALKDVFKKRFIKLRTTILTQYASRVSVSAGQIKSKSLFKSGLFDYTNIEDEKATNHLLYSISSLVREVNTELFLENYPDFRGMDYKDYKDKYNNYVHTNILNLGSLETPKNGGIVFALSSKVNSDLELVGTDPKQNLVYYDLGSSTNKINNIKQSINIKGGDPELSFVPLCFDYTNRGSAGVSDNKKTLKREAGRNVKITTYASLAENYTREEYFKLLQPAYKHDSYRSCGAFNEVTLADITLVMSTWVKRPEVQRAILSFDEDKLLNYKEALIFIGYEGELPDEEGSKEDILNELVEDLSFNETKEGKKEESFDTLNVDSEDIFG